MPIDREKVRAIVFDYGNTLIEFTAPQVRALETAIGLAIQNVFGPFDLQKYIDIRRRDYRSPYSHPELRESTIPGMFEATVWELYSRRATPAQIESLIAVHDEHFVKLIDAPDYLDALLSNLHRRYRLALVSNYPCGRSIRGSLQRTGIARHMDAIVISGEVGYVKPHPLPFQTVVEQLGVGPGEIVFVGDNWLGDVQGAKRLGMYAVHTLQFDTLEVFDRQDGHHDADLTIHHLRELEDHL